MISNFSIFIFSVVLANFLEVTNDLTVQGTKDDAYNWLFDDGTHMPYFNWNNGDGQPNNSSEERYITIKKLYSWQWHDVGADHVNRFLCEIYA